MMTDPERALRRCGWTAFSLATVPFMLSFFHRVAPAAIAGDLQREFNTTGAQLGALAASYFYTYAVMQLPTGVLADTLGPRRIITVGCVVAGIGSVLFGLAATLEMASFGRSLIGLGVSVMFVSMLKINAAWFHEREFATVSGYSVLLGNLAALLGAGPLAWLTLVVSWRSVFIVLGIFSAILAALIWFKMKDSPREAALATSQGAPEAPAEHDPPQRWYRNLAVVMANHATWPGFFVFIGVAGSYTSFVGLWAVPYLMQVHGMSRETAAGHTTLMLLSFGVSAMLIGGWSDRAGKRRPIIIGTGFVYLLCWLYWIVTPPMPVGASLALSALMGAAASGFTLIWACTKEVNPPQLAGTSTSLVNTGVFFGTGCLQPLVGWVLDRGAGAGVVLNSYSVDDFRRGLGVLAGAAVLGFVATLFMRETHCRNIWSTAREK